MLLKQFEEVESEATRTRAQAVPVRLSGAVAYTQRVMQDTLLKVHETWL